MSWPVTTPRRPRCRSATSWSGATSIVLDVRTNVLLDGALDGVQLELVTLVLDAGPQWATAAGTLADLWSRRGLAPDAAAAVLGADPVGDWAASGGGVDLGALTEDTVRWATRAPAISTPTS